MNKTIAIATFLLSAVTVSTTVIAGDDPSSYQIYTTGFQHSQSLQEQLKQTRGELFFRDMGLFVGAADTSNQDQNKPTSKTDGNIDINAYAGIKKKLGLLGYHFGVMSYNNAQNTNIKLQEYFVGGSVKNLSFSYASNENGEDYTQLNLSRVIASMSIGIHLGETNTLYGNKYRDWSLHASKVFKDYKINAIMTTSEDPIIKGTAFNLGMQKNLKWF